MKIETNCEIRPMMRLMYPIASILMRVDEDELVMATQESYAFAGPGKGDHRYQVLFIPRDDHMAGFWTDLGPKSDFKMMVGEETFFAPPYFQPVLQCHTVAECRHMAEDARMDDYAARLLQASVDESTLFARYQALIENDLRLVKNQSTFGSGVRVQRDGYSRMEARERELRQQERQHRGQQ